LKKEIQAPLYLYFLMNYDTTDVGQSSGGNEGGDNNNVLQADFENNAILSMGEKSISVTTSGSMNFNDALTAKDGGKISENPAVFAYQIIANKGGFVFDKLGITDEFGAKMNMNYTNTIKVFEGRYNETTGMWEHGDELFSPSGYTVQAPNQNGFTVNIAEQTNSTKTYIVEYQVTPNSGNEAGTNTARVDLKNDSEENISAIKVSGKVYTGFTKTLNLQALTSDDVKSITFAVYRGKEGEAESTYEWVTDVNMTVASGLTWSSGPLEQYYYDTSGARHSWLYFVKEIKVIGKNDNDITSKFEMRGATEGGYIPLATINTQNTTSGPTYYWTEVTNDEIIRPVLPQTGARDILMLVVISLTGFVSAMFILKRKVRETGEIFE
jgi:hypothetical protein